MNGTNGIAAERIERVCMVDLSTRVPCNPCARAARAISGPSPRSPGNQVGGRGNLDCRGAPDAARGQSLGVIFSTAWTDVITGTI